MISAEALPRTLIDLGLLDAAGVVEHGCEVTGAGRRNQNHVVRAGPVGLFVKSPRQRDDRGLIDHEATVAEHLAGAGMADVVPTLRGRLPDSAGAVYRLEPGETLHAMIAASRRPVILPVRAAAAALARLHDGAPGPGRPISPLPLLVPCPPIALVTSFSAGGRELLRVVQREEAMMSALEELAARWQPESFVHGDVKWDNVIVRGAGSSGRRTRAVLVDWELAGTGDWRWDVGSFVSEYLRLWLLSFPVIETWAPDLLLHRARFPLQRAQPSLRAFVSAYTRYRGVPLDPAGDLVPFVAARLLQSAFEMSAENPRLDGRSLLMTQVSANMVREPVRAASVLLGL
ncbi:MAG: aminoglycoside phosphotransferase family protein [Actinomycetes bacterium]|nr:aminoglycoside phosphotransferase family protein [Actinomycetes bacterium]MDX5380005.1 aminoglycoside phosphotransferase family protein [Actinomycetes bacterium]MDX5398547.1 aminoglycoside phosphotransferase family protein [Actinomycetes bacterium]MDX5449701.1 aminoglycoside phosphotransferase family protein [Actinomycetes bacterium]